jgi:hypothetical protein
MTEHIKIQIVFAIICVFEAWLEEIIIKLKNPELPNYQQLNSQEHKRSAYWFGSLVLGITVITEVWLLPIYCILLRRIFFDFPLKKFRKRKFREIEGDQFVDNLSRKIFGSHGGLFELATCLILLVGFNFISRLF